MVEVSPFELLLAFVEVSPFELLLAFARQQWPDADVYMQPSTGDYVVSVRVSRKQLVADRTDALRRTFVSLKPRAVKGRRLHWGRRTRRRA